MPCTYTVTRDGQIVIEVWEGTITLNELIAHKQKILRDPLIGDRVSILSDCTQARFEIALDAVSKLSEMEGGSDSRSKVSGYAFLLSSDLYERARLFSEQVQSHGKSVIIFNLVETAATRLGMDAAEIRAIIDGMRVAALKQNPEIRTS